MKLAELMDIPVHYQTAKPVSPGSRGLKLNKHRPAKRYFDVEALDEGVDFCIHCNNLVISEAYKGGLRKWFKDKWVNIAKKKKGGGHPECGTSGDKKGYANCVPASKARSMTKNKKTIAKGPGAIADQAASRETPS